LREVSYPVLVRPAETLHHRQNSGIAKAAEARSADELGPLLEAYRGAGIAAIIAESLLGQRLVQYSIPFARRDTRTLSFVARKVRQWPPETGTSASGVECRDDVVLEATIRLFGGLGYRGLAYLEMKRDPRTRRHFVIEPNIGRPTGRSAIAEAGGVDLLWTMYCDVVGLPLPARTVQQYGGAKWLDVRRDLQSAMHDWRRGALTPRQWLGSLRGPVFHAIWARDDPWPFFFDVGQATGKGIRRVASRATRRVRHRRRPASDGEVD